MASNPKLDAINSETATPLSAQVSISLHPDTILPFANDLVGDGGIAEDVYRAGREAMKTMYESLLAVEQAVAQMSVPTDIVVRGQGKVLKNLVPENRKVELATAMNASFERAARRYDSSCRAIKEAISTIETRISAALTDPNKDRASAAQAASEVRGILRSLAPHERFSAVHNAIEEGDTSIVHAVLGAPPLNSGLDRKTHTLLRELAEKRFAPKETAQRAAAQKVLSAALNASELYTKRFVHLSPKIGDNPREKALQRLREEV